MTALVQTPGGYLASEGVNTNSGTYSSVRLLNDMGVSTSAFPFPGQNGETNCLIALPDHIYLAAGRSYIPFGSSHAWMPGDAAFEKVDAQGNVLWNNTQDGQLKNGTLGDDYITAAVPCPDGTILLAGTTSSSDNEIKGNHGSYDAWLVKVDAMGKVLWNKVYGGSGADMVQAIVPTADGNYLIAANTGSSNGDMKTSHGQKDIWLFKVDGNGNFLGGQTFGGSKDDVLNNSGIASSLRNTRDPGSPQSGTGKSGMTGR